MMFHHVCETASFKFIVEEDQNIVPVPNDFNAGEFRRVRLGTMFDDRFAKSGELIQ